jgi:hypothetical protein
MLNNRSIVGVTVFYATRVVSEESGKRKLILLELPARKAVPRDLVLSRLIFPLA